MDESFNSWTLLFFLGVSPLNFNLIATENQTKLGREEHLTWQVDIHYEMPVFVLSEFFLC